MDLGRFTVFLSIIYSLNKLVQVQGFNHKGDQTLKAVSKADNFNEWIYDQIKPWANGKILEVGSGIGNISKHFIDEDKNIVLSDLRSQYFDYLNGKYAEKEVIQMDIVDTDFDTKYKGLHNSFDLVFAINVVEHIDNDRLATENMAKLLKPDGFMFILVPAYGFLFNSFDKSLQHYRRYQSGSLKKILPKKMRQLDSWYFNFAGIFGWYLVGTILKKEVIPDSNMKLYNFLTPILKLVDKITLNKVGLSVISVSQKDSAFNT